MDQGSQRIVSQNVTIPAADVAEILARTENIWDEFRDASIFITGGTGFFGHWMLETFSAANARFGLNARALVLSRNPPPPTDPAIQFHAGEIRAFDFPKGSFSHIIHAATPASATLNNERPDEMRDIIVAGTRRILDFATQSGASKLLLCSSGAVYGTQPRDLAHIPEDYTGAPNRLDPKFPYADGKLAAEQMCVDEPFLETKIARGFAFVGPYLPLDIHFAIGNFLRDALAGRPIIIKGDGTAIRSYLYAADLAIWLWTILARGEPARPYNVGSECAISIADLARLVADTVAPGTSVEILTAPRLGQTPERYVPSTARARSELYLAEYTDLRESIRRTAEWHRLRGSS